MYAAAGIFGALAGSTLGKAVDEPRLLFLFALVMVAVGVLMLRGRHDAGRVDWPLAGVFIAGGVVGGLGGTSLARRLSSGGMLRTVFAGLIFAVAAYVLWRSTAM